jgi:hypothetical protein
LGEEPEDEAVRDMVPAERARFSLPAISHWPGTFFVFLVSNSRYARLGKVAEIPASARQ